MRLGLISEMSATIRAKLFSGEQVEQFVMAVSDKDLSVRDIKQLAHGYFRGPDSFRQEILKGNLALPSNGSGKCPKILMGAASLSA